MLEETEPSREAERAERRANEARRKQAEEDEDSWMDEDADEDDEEEADEDVEEEVVEGTIGERLRARKRAQATRTLPGEGGHMRPGPTCYSQLPVTDVSCCDAAVMQPLCSQHASSVHAGDLTFQQVALYSLGHCLWCYSRPILSYCGGPQIWLGHIAIATLVVRLSSVALLVPMCSGDTGNATPVKSRSRGVSTLVIPRYYGSSATAPPFEPHSRKNVVLVLDLWLPALGEMWTVTAAEGQKTKVQK
ncbi:hypothetical protein B0H10DRAFT_1941618 [Mycena sp. CBHHK59/15]|nr:hypothetical protein B0H10DRAFT_1941618 [Mycena sp. CBHHK59/15]